MKGCVPTLYSYDTRSGTSSVDKTSADARFLTSKYFQQNILIAPIWCPVKKPACILWHYVVHKTRVLTLALLSPSDKVVSAGLLSLRVSIAERWSVSLLLLPISLSCRGNWGCASDAGPSNVWFDVENGLAGISVDPVGFWADCTLPYMCIHRLTCDR